MIQRKTIQETIDLLLKGEAVYIVDDFTPDAEVHKAFLAKPLLDTHKIEEQCPAEALPLIVLGYERYGLATGVRKNGNFEYDEDFVNLQLAGQSDWDDGHALTRFVEGLMKARPGAVVKPVSADEMKAITTKVISQSAAK